MATFEFQQPRFTEGVLAKSLQGRSPEEFYTYGVKSAENMIPLIEGPMIKRPGTTYVSPAGSDTSRLFPFYKGGTEAYVVEIGYNNSASDTTKTHCTSSGTPATTITLGGGQNTTDLVVGQHIWGTGVDGNTTAFPTTKKETSTQIASITNSTVFTITNPVTSGISAGTLKFSNKPFIRIYSQDKLLNIYNTTTPYTIKSHRWIIDANIDEVEKLKVSQSGDILFVTCPTKTPFLISRTLEPTNSARAEDDSVWTVSEYEALDGPYQNVNADNDLALKITGTEVSEELGDITFDVENNLVVMANHGLQTGQKINLSVANTTSNATGNTQIIVKNGTVDPTITTDVAVVIDGADLKFTTTNSHGLRNNDIVHIDSAGTLATGLSDSVDYFVVSAAYTSFKLSTAEGGGAVAHSSSNVGSGQHFIGTNRATSFGVGDKLLGEHPNPPTGTAFSSNSGVDNTFYVVYSTSVAFQISDSPSNKAFDIGYRDLDAAVPPVAGEQFSGKVTLKTSYYEEGSDITCVSRVNVSGTWANASTSNGGQVFTDADIGRMIRINPLADTTSRRGGIKWGWGKITARANDYTITVKLSTNLSIAPDSINGTPEWRLGAFSGYTDYSDGSFIGLGYPQISQIYQQRFVFAATNYDPSTVWLSRSGNFYDYAPTDLGSQDTPLITGGIASEVILDSNSLTFTIDSDTLDEIMWLMDSKKLAIGTSAGVYFLYGTETNLSLTPTRFTVSRETSYSASNVQPVIVSNVIIYPQRGGREIQELEFSGAEDQWLQSRISMKAYDMIATSSVIKISWQERPNPIIWMVMENGQVLSLSYDRAVKFKAWAIHTIGGSYNGGNAKVTDLAVIPRTDYDQVWFKVKRTVNGSEVNYIERLERFPSEQKITRNELVFLDSAKIHKNTDLISGTPVVKGGSQSTSQNTLVVRYPSAPATAPAANTRFVIAGDSTIYKVASATTPSDSVDGIITSTWTLDQNLVVQPANLAVIELRLEELTISHLEGQSVGICTNGMEHSNKTISSNKITLDHALTTTAVSGLGYTAQMETLSPPTPDNQYTFLKRLLTLTVLIQESLGIEIEYNATTEELLFRSTQQNTGSPIDFFNGFKKSSLSGIGWDAHNVIIRSISPLPMQINSLSIEVETGGP